MANGSPEMRDSLSGRQLATDFLRHRYELMGFVMLLVRDPHVAEDIFQDVWIALDKAVGRGEEIEHLGRWCRGVARNLVLKRWREERCARSIPSSDWLEKCDLAFSEQETYDSYPSARQECLKRCLESLPDRARALLGMRYEQGLSMSAIAGRCSRSVAAVTKSLSRIRSLLNECVDRHLRLEMDP